MSDFKPGCDTQALEARARMLKAAREFFDSRGYLEVQTPSLSRNTASDPFLGSFEVCEVGGPRYLQTSPEFHMKRLLATAPRPIYQICGAFRRGETGRLHNSEFTILEYYAPSASATDMAQLTCALIDKLYKPEEIRRTSYRELVQEAYGLEVSTAGPEQFLEAARGVATHADAHNALDVLYDGALSDLSGRVLVQGFPASLASLAAIAEDGSADRFEVIINGIEIANGCQELLDADEFKQRVDYDNAVRHSKGLPQIECDPRLKAALSSGLAPVSGVALGLDRLLMLKLGKQHLSEVLAFSDEIA